MMHILSPNEINDHVLNQLYDFELTFWPDGTYGHLTKEYYFDVYQDHPECIFCAKEADKIIGEFNILFPSKTSIDQYFRSKEFMDLDNLGIHKGKNILYLNTALVDKKYRGTNLLKILLEQMSLYLINQEQNGCIIDVAYGEAVTKKGGIVAQSFGMESIDTDQDGIGHYIAKDGLHKYLQQYK